MSSTILNIIPRKQAEASATAQYTVPNNKTAIIDKFTVTNTSSVAVPFSVYLVASGGTVGDDNKVLDNYQVGVEETYTCPELVGQVLQAGGFISTVAGAVSSLTISASGRQIS